MKTCYAKKRSSSRRAGFSLLEIMVALLLLSVLTLGGAAMLMRSGETVAFQEKKRAAIEAAHRRMEMVRSTPSSLFDSFPRGSPRFLFYNGTSFSIHDSNPGETVVVDGVSMPISTRIIKIRRSSPDYAAVEVFRIVVVVNNRRRNSDSIVLKSYYR